MEEANKEFLARAAKGEQEDEQRVARVRAFVAALRSGQFRQTHGVLHRPDDPARNVGNVGHCCLGVACEVAISGGLVLDRIVVPAHGDPRTWFGIVDPVGNDIGSKETLPSPVKDWFGFDDSNPYLLVPREVAEKADVTFANFWSKEKYFSASSLNDDFQFSFPWIADCFEYTFLREDWNATRAAN